ncbi:sugar ABC transporter substrate-binding protein [Burkholderia reimsis]|uniref:Sugar ABC transporter substrate-binding protein n=1 Tax=Burkholderia reimsis TaxID=2234132 RepID=A0A365QGI5_9BURK|nr:ABC transporter substrate-binding protein [Burkholderia reimsis]RBB31511.1 sugar ABC transporter substrate-binding protein [Burkholderia reimsis]
MNRRQILVAGAGSVLNIASRGATPSFAKARVVFLNPGESTERETGQHWQLVSKFMSIAAKNFGMQLEVLYAERDHMLMVRQAEEVANRVDAPDYVVIVNEKMAALDMLRLLSRTSSKIVLIHNDLTNEQRRVVGDERRRIRNWIGTLTADANSAGYRLMDYLCRDRRFARLRVIGITGDPNTPVSMERATGVGSWLARAPHAHINQLVFSNWSFSDSYEKALVLLARYPETNVIWGANDSITLAALKAAETRQVRAVVGGIGALQEALQRVMKGTLRAMMAGDYFIGAFAMVLINDYHNGRDFATRGSARIKADFLTVVQAENAASYYDAIFLHPHELNFGVYSTSRYRNDGPYDFRLSHLLGEKMATA